MTQVGADVKQTLFGREQACARVNQTLAAARNGRGELLCVVGAAGMGKSALLQYAAEEAVGIHVIRAKGSLGESGLAHAGLSQILGPLQDLIPALPASQGEATTAVLTTGASTGVDVFPVLAGTMGLLALAASSSPLVVLLDDAQWLDDASFEALLFAQRRLGFDPVSILMTFRLDEGSRHPPSDAPVLELKGLDRSAAAALLAEEGYLLSEDQSDWLVHATGGNPLALRDLPTYARAEDLATYALSSDPAPIGKVLEAAYGATLASMPRKAQEAALIAAILDDAELDVLRRSLRSRGLTFHDIEPAEAAGLVVITQGALRLRHPLIRSAIVQSATPAARRAAHMAAAEGLLVSDHPRDQEARVWHLAAAAVGVAEDVAILLEQLADSYAVRAGYSSACLTYERAAGMSPRKDDRLRRLRAAAEAALAGGLSTQCATLLDKAREVSNVGASTQRAISHIQGRLDAWSGKPLKAARQLQNDAEQARRIDPPLSLRLSLDATVAAVLAGDVEAAFRSACTVREIALELGPTVIPLGDLMVGAVRAMRGDGNTARGLLDSCCSALDMVEPSMDGLQHMTYLAVAYTFIDALDVALPLFRRSIHIARRRSAIGLLPFALTHSAVADFRSGNWDLALAGASEGLSLAIDTRRATEQPNALAVLAMIRAARGEEEARDLAQRAISEASAMGASFIEAQGYSMLGLLELGTGHPAAAIPPLRQCGQMATEKGLLELGHLQWAADLVESLARSGSLSEVDSTLQVMRDQCHDGATALNQALFARAKGIVDTSTGWEVHFRVALELHGGPNERPFETARTQLCYGERLRRHRRRKDARVQLGASWEMMSALGAKSWTRRAAQELEATGTISPGMVTRKTDLLTPQEYQVATLTASGASNREIADTLFLSQKTVEFHLSAVYRRLGIRSRSELGGLIAKA